MASGVFGVARVRPGALDSDARPHERVEGGVCDLQAVGPPPPVVQRLRRSAARLTAEGPLKTGEDRGRQGDGLAGRDIGDP
jgi:hypothetical protein